MLGRMLAKPLHGCIWCCCCSAHVAKTTLHAVGDHLEWLLDGNLIMQMFLVTRCHGVHLMYTHDLQLS